MLALRLLLAALLVLALPQAAPARKAKAPVRESEPAPRFDASLFQKMEWRLIGPFRGGRSTAVAGVAGDPFTYYFGATGGGLWKTTDGGLTWKNVSDGHFATGSVGAVAVAPGDPNVVWVGMGEAPVRGVMTTHGDGVYRSTDGGRSWTHLGLEATRHISRLRVHPRDPDTAWVAAQGHLWGPNPERGVYKTTDGGKTWRRVLHVDPDTGASDLALDVTNPRVLYAAMWQHRRHPWKIESGGPGSGIHKSTDGGETWEELTDGLPGLMGKIGVAVSPARPERVWAMIEAEEGGLFRSDDGGGKWKRINEERVLRARAWYYTHVIADPRDADTVWVLNAPAMKSVDGGKSFTPVPTPHGDNHDLWINPEETRFLINANDGGANVSFNGGETWTTQANQPTAQLYRVITDNRFPYRVYGGQQDNTAIAILSRSMDGSIDRRHWHSIGGCESAYPAFDPEDPRWVYAGCFQGLITEWDAVTESERPIMAYPQLNLSTDPAQQRYRFNWNAPIVTSPHDRSVIYHAGNVVLKSADRGVTWEEISPDLTRDEEERQGPGGGPITNEGAGGEVYNTLLALVESPHEAGTIWAGSDDGLVHLTRDGGGSWSNVTPPGVGEAMINAIEVSPHDPATAYLAVTRYKWDDLAPMIFKTDDFGASWRDLAGALPEETVVRVVREDPGRRGLLYAGTEKGLFVSWDDGRRWQSLQLNLPVVPITDLTIRQGDLVASTQGRAFWILDDLTPLRAIDDAAAAADLHLLPPRDAYLTGGGRSERPGAFGVNPPNGVVIHYLLARPNEADETAEGSDEGSAGTSDDGEDQDGVAPPLVIEIYDAAGELVRRVTSEKKEDEGSEGAEKPLSSEPGMNRWVWDLRYQDPAKVDKIVVFGSDGGPRVGPGAYRVRLSRAETALEQEVRVLPDPRSEIAAEDFRERRELMLAVRERLHAVNDLSNRLTDAKAQVEALVERVEHLPGADEIRESGEALAERLADLDERLVQRKTSNFQDVINFPNRLNAEYAFLLGVIDQSFPPLSAGVRERLADIDLTWETLREESRRLLDDEMARFDAVFRKHEVPAVILRSPEPSMPEAGTAAPDSASGRDR